MHPILFKVGNFPVHAWGVLLMIGFLLGTWRAAHHAMRYKIAPEDLWDAALFGLFGGVIGGRLAYVAQNLPEFAAHPGQIFAMWNGGMTSFGGLIGGVGVGLLVMHLRKRNLLDSADLAAPSLAIGYFWGRIGCYLNGCCFGGACPDPLGVQFPLLSGTVHATQLYSAFAAAVIYGVLVLVEKRRQFRGQLILLFALLYSLYRFIVEFFREGATADLSGIASLTTAQVACLAIALLAGAYYVYRMRAYDNTSPEPGPVSTDNQNLSTPAA
ncbi:MAG: prolipoprotein diacylglyceryl transferase [Fibrella sp.]|nr:prolipoprotein diacylglyceryl transferase [Armatimonadota bacterium]